MGCEVIRTPDGGPMFLCRGRSGRRANCAEPGCDREHVALCDYPTGPRGGTCSRRMCACHRTRMPGGDVDCCPRRVAVAGSVPRVRAAPPVQLLLGEQPGLSHDVGARR